MSATSSYDKDVYTGIWTNHALGKWKGSTLTLDHQKGAFLIAFLALFVGATGRSFWRIIRFLTHTFLSTEASSDGLHHQRQAILRNSALALDATWDILESRFAWQRRTGKIDKRTWPLAMTASAVAAVFVIAGIFSSRVTAGTANEVLIAGQNCGNMTGTLPTEISAQALVWSDYYSANTQKASEYLNYAYRCYRNQSNADSKGCDTYIKRTLPYTKNTSADCPFNQEMCLTSRSNLWLQTPLLDSQEDLGLNDGPRFQLQLTRHCGPLVLDNFTDVQTDESDASIKWMRYFYGPSLFSNTSYSLRLRYNNTRSPTDWHGFMEGPDYTITSPTDIDLIPQLKVSGASTSVMWLESTGIKNYAKIEDPWFRATTAMPLPDWVSKARDLILPNNEYMTASDPAGVMGCATTAKICNPNMPEEKRCYNPREQDALLSDQWPDKNDQNTIQAYIQYIFYMYRGLVYTPDAYYTTRGLPSLTTRFTLNGLLQPERIPPNRWQEEMEYIFQTNLAGAQGQLAELATGRTPPSREAFSSLCVRVHECNRRCYSQKIRVSSYYSFSVLGISIILCIGTLILVVGIFIEPIFYFFCGIFGIAQSRRFLYARLEWQSGSTLQFQRLAHEGVGSGTWTGTDKSIPVTQPGEQLAKLDISDSKHPKLVNEKEMANVSGTSYRAGRSQEDLNKSPQDTKFTSTGRTKYDRLSSTDDV